jgi:hypothetical protein
VSNSQNSSTYTKAVESNTKLVQAEKAYDAVIGQFVASGPITGYQELPRPKRILDSVGMEEIKTAEENKRKAEIEFQKALDEYYRSINK